ncbi:Phosphoribosyl transferase domain containing protein [Leishmania braziliensis]|nr:Phosphoribosyl transferase domain containing protein [Leishmania braziliensis]
MLGIETRGCILGAPLALLLGLPFVPVRRDDISENTFVTEGDSKLPAVPIAVRHSSISAASRVVIVDEFISSSRTMDSAMDCAVVAGLTVVKTVAVCDMSTSGGVDYIHREKRMKNANVVTLFRLRSCTGALFLQMLRQVAHMRTSRSPLFSLAPVLKLSIDGLFVCTWPCVPVFPRHFIVASLRFSRPPPSLRYAFLSPSTCGYLCAAPSLSFLPL